MRRMIWILMFCLAAVVAPAEEALSLPELPESAAETSSEKKNPAPAKEREEDTELDRILSGEQALPVLNEERIAAKVDRRFSEAENWFVREKDAIFTLLIASGIAILAGAALAFGLRWLVARSDAECRRMRWQFVAALSGPVILMAVSGVIFLFLLPVLHSLPELYPLDARLFFTWITLLAARAGFQLITLLDVKMRAFAKRPDNSLDSLMVDITRKLLKIVLAVVTVLFIGQSIFQLNITTLLAGAGVVGLAVAFASRETLSNFFGTLVIILDRPFRIGDRVQIGDVNGLVQSVGMRSTRVITANESVFSIPNSRIAEQPIENISTRGVIRYALVLGLDYATSAEQLQQAMTILREITTDFKGKDQPQYFPRIFFEEFGASALNIRVIMWLKTTSFDREEQLRTEVNLTILQRFNEAGLSFAFNTVTNNLTGSVQLLPPSVPASPQS